MKEESRSLRWIVDRGRFLSFKAINKIRERLDYSEEELVDIDDVSDN